MDKLDELIKINEGLIYKIASKFKNIPKEDLYQAGVVGIIKAYNNYKDIGLAKFSTYAFKHIFGEMYETANNFRPIRLNKKILNLYKKLEQAKSILTQKNNKEPSLFELSSFLNLDLKTITMIYQCTNSILSIDNDNNKEIIYSIKEPNNKINEAKIDLVDSLKNLNSQELKIIKYRYFNDYSQSETAKKLGLSQVKVSREEKKSLSKMYNYLTN